MAQHLQYLADMNTTLPKVEEALVGLRGAITSLTSALEGEVPNEARILRQVIQQVRALTFRTTTINGALLAARRESLLEEAGRTLTRRLQVDRAEAGACFQFTGQYTAGGDALICGAPSFGQKRAGWPCCAACSAPAARPTLALC
jgi:hypothetical protein